jgi:hypothetical protein
MRVPHCLFAQALASDGSAAADLALCLDGRRRVGQDLAAAGLLEVDRKCVVCDWTGTVQENAETPEIAGQCPTCHAPTERLRVRRQWEHVPNEHAAALGRLGGLKGGPARAAALSPKRRREIARAAAAARWKRR